MLYLQIPIFMIPPYLPFKQKTRGFIFRSVYSMKHPAYRTSFIARVFVIARIFCILAA